MTSTPTNSADVDAAIDEILLTLYLGANFMQFDKAVTAKQFENPKLAEAKQQLKALISDQVKAAQLALLKEQTAISVFVSYDDDNGRGVAVPQSWINDRIAALSPTNDKE